MDEPRSSASWPSAPPAVHERRLPGEPRARAERLLDPQQPVVLRDALTPAAGAGLEVSGADRDREIRDRRVLGLPRPVRHEDAVACGPRDRDRLESFGDGADLVELDEDGVRDLLPYPAGDDRGVRAEDVVADELDLLPEPLRQALPAVPVLLGEAVLEKQDRVLPDPLFPEIDHLVG